MITLHKAALEGPELDRPAEGQLVTYNMDCLPNSPVCWVDGLGTPAGGSNFGHTEISVCFNPPMSGEEEEAFRVELEARLNAVKEGTWLVSILQGIKEEWDKPEWRGFRAYVPG